MPWEVWLVLALAAAVLIGSAAVAGQDPRFWWGMGLLAWKEIKPGVLAELANDFSPAHGKKVADAARQAKEADWKGMHGHVGEH